MEDNVYLLKTGSLDNATEDFSLVYPWCRARGADFQVGGLTGTRKREPTRGVRGHAPPGKFEILFF